MKATRYEHTEDGFVYTITRSKNGWSVIRHPVDFPNLPPKGEHLTKHGWVGIIQLGSDDSIGAQFFSDEETALANAQANR
jgi:hypothetical protein